MRNQWRILLRHTLVSSSSSSCVPRISRPIFLNQVSSSSSSPFTLLNHRYYSSNPPGPSKLPHTSLLIDIFSKPDPVDLDSHDILLTPDLVVETLKHLSSQPLVAIKLFHCLSHNKPSLLDSTSYNLILGILASSSHVSDFWDTFHAMKKKGFGIKRGAFDTALDNFSKHGFTADAQKLKDLFLKKENIHTFSTRILRIVRREPWDAIVENDLKTLPLSYSPHLVQLVLQKLAFSPTKALLFFRWLQDAALFKHDPLTYNTMAVILGRQDSIDSFWNLVGDMRNQGFQMELKTFLKVLGRFIDRGMMKDAVALYEFAMDGANKPSPKDCTFLLKKLAVAKGDLDLDLFSRVIKSFTQKGLPLEDCMLDSVLKSLTGVGRMKECKDVLDVMVEAGFSPSGSMKAKVAYNLSRSKLTDQADQNIENLVDQGSSPDYKTWSSMIQGHCVAGNFDKAKDCFDKMVEKVEVRYVGYPLNVLVNAYCDRYRGAEACKLLADVVNNNSKIEPWHLTYKTLITKLIGQKGFVDALPLLGLMKKHGFAPFVTPFIKYLSEKGTTEEAMQFFKAVTAKKYPSTALFVQTFEAYSKSGRHEQAQDLLLKCPQFIRNNADVLNIFCCMKSEKLAEPKLASVAA